jgi:hypothetical protein
MKRISLSSLFKRTITRNSSNEDDDPKSDSISKNDIGAPMGAPTPNQLKIITDDPLETGALGDNLHML